MSTLKEWLDKQNFNPLTIDWFDGVIPLDLAIKLFGKEQIPYDGKHNLLVQARRNEITDKLEVTYLAEEIPNGEESDA